MLFQYPSMLPPFLSQGYGYEDDDDLIRTDIQGGPSDVIKRTHQGCSAFSVSSNMTDTQFAIFEAWVTYALNGGVCWFEIPMPVGHGMVTHTARLVDKYNANRATHGKWTVSAVIEVATRAVEEL